MSSQLIVQLKQERDKYSMKAYTYKQALENIANNFNPKTGKAFENEEEKQTYIREILSN